MSNANLPVGFGDRGPPHRGGVISHVPGEDRHNIKAADEVAKRLGKT